MRYCAFSEAVIAEPVAGSTEVTSSGIPTVQALAPLSLAAGTAAAGADATSFGGVGAGCRSGAQAARRSASPTPETTVRAHKRCLKHIPGLPFPNPRSVPHPRAPRPRLRESAHGVPALDAF